MRYKCLVFDHDDTVVNSTATIHYPCFVKYLALHYPERRCSLEEYFLKNFNPGFVQMCKDDFGMSEEDMDREVEFWSGYVNEHVPEAYKGIREIMETHKARGGLICVVSHSNEDTIRQDYAAAASFFRLSTAGGDITVAAQRDYAVALGKLKDFEAADQVLQEMIAAGAEDLVTAYVQAEVDYAREEYLAAESGFLAVLEGAEDAKLQVRALRSLAELYRDCAALEQLGSSPISCAATKEARLLADGIAKFGLQYDSTLWEMLAMACFEAAHTDPGAEGMLEQSAEAVERVLELGVQKEYLYSNLYTVYYELGRYDDAQEVLVRYEAAFPDDYMPHALRGMMLIAIENGKEQAQRDYAAAAAEYELAGSMLRSDDDTTYYQQLGSLIEQLSSGGWL